MDRLTPCDPSTVNGREQYVLYWMTPYRRTHFNYALERAVSWATELRGPLLIFEPLACYWRELGFNMCMNSASTARKLGIKG